MEITLNRDILLPALQVVAPAIETKQTLPVLSNVLWTQQGETLTLLGTDLEIELTAPIKLEGDDAVTPAEGFATTIPARKLLDIMRSLPEGVSCDFRFTPKQCQISTPQNRFVLSTMPADDYPRLKEEVGDIEFLIKQSDFLKLLQSTYFAMAVQDVRYYLNGLFIDIRPGSVVSIATDGHRLAHCEVKTNLHDGIPETSFLLPRNAVIELVRLLETDDSMLTVTIGKGYCRIAHSDFTFASKLIEGRTPNYKKAIPTRGDNVWTVDKNQFKSAVSRVALVINDRTKGVKLVNTENKLQLHTYDAESGEADAQIEGEFLGESIEVGLNAAYLLDVINALNTKKVQLYFNGPNSSATMVGEGVEDVFYVIMPMRV